MEEYEDKIQYEIDGEPVHLDWVIYRDDTFFEWQHLLDQLYEFWNYLNTIHSAIKWDKPIIEHNGVINFLDILMKKLPDGKFITSVSRKDTHSDRYLHFTSYHPLSQRMSAVATLKYRAEYYCSSPELLKAELNHLHNVFLENGYPS